jgi:hypothetical protein
MKGLCPNHDMSSAEISFALMIDANERVGHHHDEHCAIFLERLFDADIQLANCGSARGNTKVGRKIGGRTHFGSERQRGKGTDWVPLRGPATFQTHHPSNRSGEELRPLKATESVFWLVPTNLALVKRVPLRVPTRRPKAPAAGFFRLFSSTIKL